MNILLIVLLRLILLIPGHSLSPQISTEQVMFVWDSEIINEQVLEDLSAVGFDTLYIYLSDRNIKTFSETVDLCSDYDMSVYALNGSYEWLGDSDQLEDFLKLIKNVEKKDHGNFKGVVLDIEPYVLDTDDENKAYEDFMDLIIMAREASDDLDLQLNTVIPFWYEKVHVPGMSVNENLASWVQVNSDEVTIMAYRNTLSGSNGIVQLIDEELKYSVFTKAKIIVALESRPSKEGEHISFDLLGKNSVLMMFERLKRQFVFYPSDIIYGLHDLKSWLALID